MVTIQTLTDKTDAILRAIQSLEEASVLVGIPEKTAKRSDGSITNAQLAYIQTHGVRKKAMRQEMEGQMNTGMPYSRAFEMYVQAHGSPLWHIPPRPIIEPAIESVQDQVAEKLKRVAQLAMDGSSGESNTELKALGIFVQNVVREWFANPANKWAPNAPSTIAKKGSDKPLIDTGALRRSITYVIGGKGGAK